MTGTGCRSTGAEAIQNALQIGPGTFQHYDLVTAGHMATSHELCEIICIHNYNDPYVNLVGYHEQVP